MIRQANNNEYRGFLTKLQKLILYNTRIYVFLHILFHFPNTGMEEQTDKGTDKISPRRNKMCPKYLNHKAATNRKND